MASKASGTLNHPRAYRQGHCISRSPERPSEPRHSSPSLLRYSLRRSTQGLLRARFDPAILMSDAMAEISRGLLLKQVMGVFLTGEGQEYRRRRECHTTVPRQWAPWKWTNSHHLNLACCRSLCFYESSGREQPVHPTPQVVNVEVSGSSVGLRLPKASNSRIAELICVRKAQLLNSSKPRGRARNARAETASTIRKMSLSSGQALADHLISRRAVITPKCTNALPATLPHNDAQRSVPYVHR